MIVTAEPRVEPRGVALRSRGGLAVVAATVLASMVGFVDAYMINVAVPAIGRSLHAGLAGLQWVLAGYLLTVAALLLLAGSLADRLGRRRSLMLGLAVMLTASVACAAAPTIGALIAARVVQGIGGALVVPSSLALLNGTLRPADRASGIGWWAGISTIGSTVGPYAGGWLVDHASWRWVFLLNVPLVLAALAVLLVVPENAGARGAWSFDAAGGALAVLGLGGVIYALTAGPDSGWASPSVLIAAVFGVAGLAALLPVERRRPRPMLRTALFRSRQFDAINVATLVLYGALAAASYLVVLQCELRLGYSPTKAGAALIPESAVFLLVSPLTGAIVGRAGVRWPMAAGMLCVAGGFAWLAAARPGDPYAQAILPGAVLWGLGIGLTVAPLTAGVLAAVDDEDLGEASAINDASSRVGGVVLIALVPLLLGAHGSADLGASLADNFALAMGVMAALSVVAAAVTIAFVSRGPEGRPALPPATPRIHGCPAPRAGGTIKA